LGERPDGRKANERLMKQKRREERRDRKKRLLGGKGGYEDLSAQNTTRCSNAVKTHGAREKEARKKEVRAIK